MPRMHSTILTVSHNSLASAMSNMPPTLLQSQSHPYVISHSNMSWTLWAGMHLLCGIQLRYATCIEITWQLQWEVAVFTWQETERTVHNLSHGWKSTLDNAGERMCQSNLLKQISVSHSETCGSNKATMLHPSVSRHAALQDHHAG